MRTLLSLLLLIGSALAQDVLPDTPKPQTIRDCTGWVWHQHCRDIQVQQEVRAVVESHKTIDTPFVVVHTISFAGAFADGFISHRYIKPQNHCYEVNPFLGHYPSAAKTYGMTLGSWAATTGIDYLLKRKGKEGWFLPAVGETIVHGIGINMTYSSCHF